MEDIPNKFVEALKKLLSKNNPKNKRVIDKLKKEPEKCAEKVCNEFGSDSQPLKF